MKNTLFTLVYLSIIFLLVFLATIGLATLITAYFMKNKLVTYVTKYVVIPTYEIKYNYTNTVYSTIVQLKRPSFLLYYYDKQDYTIVAKVYNFTKEHNITLYLYDLSKPWYGIKIGENSTMPLVIPLPTPSLICLKKTGKPIIVVGKMVGDPEILYKLLTVCIKNEKEHTRSA